MAAQLREEQIECLIEIESLRYSLRINVSITVVDRPAQVRVAGLEQHFASADKR